MRKAHSRPALGASPGSLRGNVLACRSVESLTTPNTPNNEDPMNKDRIQGSAEQVKGKVKEIAGKVTGDTKLESEGKADKAAGKIQNTVGGVKDAIKEAVDD